MKHMTPIFTIIALVACARDKGTPETTPAPPVPVQAEGGPSAICDNDFQHLREDQAATEANLRAIREDMGRGTVSRERLALARDYATDLLKTKRAYREKHPGAITCFRDGGDGHLTAIKGPDLDAEIKDLDTFLAGLN